MFLRKVVAVMVNLAKLVTAIVVVLVAVPASNQDLALTALVLF
jgi:hypothetical protein